MNINIVSERDMPKGCSMIFRPTKDELYDMYYDKDMNTLQIANKLGCSRSSICNIMNDYNILRRSMSDANRIYFINKDFFKVWTHGMAYVLGYFCADGCIYKNLRFIFCSNDKNLLESIMYIMQSNHPIRKDKRNNGYYLTINSIEMVQDLLFLGVTPNKSLTLEFPNIPEEFICSFIRGIFDGDGCVYKVKNQNSIVVSITSGSDKFTLKLQSVLSENDIKVSLRRIGNELAGIMIQKKSEVKKFYDFIYQHDGIYLKRKKDIFDKFFGCD